MNLNPFTAIKIRKEPQVEDRTHAPGHYSLSGPSAAVSSSTHVVTPVSIAAPASEPDPVLAPPKQIWQWNGKNYDTEAEATAAANAAQSAKAIAAETLAIQAETPAVAETIAPDPTSADPIAETTPVKPETKPVEPETTPTPTAEAASPAPATEAPVTTAAAATTASPKESVGQEIGNFFKKLISSAAKDFSWVEGEIQKAQPAVAVAEGVASLIPGGGASVSASIALGDGIVSSGAQVIGNALNTLAAAGASTATVTPAVVTSLAAQIEQELQSDPTIAKLIAAAGGTPSNEAQFNSSLGALSSALTNLLIAI